MTSNPRSKAAERVSPVDAAWFRMENSRSPADIAALFWLDGELDEARLRTLIETRLLTRRRFRQRIVESSLRILPPHWEDDPDPSLDGHFTRRTLPTPAGEAELVGLITELVNVPIDFSRSPWRVCLIEGSAEGSIVFAQLHHSMGDGFALMQVLLSLADGAAPERTAVHQHGSRSGVWRLARRLPQELSGLTHLVRLPFDASTRLRGPLTGERRVAWSQAIALSRVKALAHAHGATINDVLMTVLAGALRQYLGERGESPHSFRAIVPVNLRPPYEPIDETHGNWFGLVYVDLPIAEGEREARLVQLKRSIDRIKASEEPIASLGLLNVLGLVPGVIGRVAMGLFGRKGTVVVSNVPGPKLEFQLVGRRVRDMLFWVPHASGLSCGVSILSYAGTLRVGVRSDAAIVRDPERIAQLFEQELRAWESAAASLDKA